MDCVLVTSPVKYPVTLEEVKRHLHLSQTNTTFDEEITDLILVATEMAETFTSRRFITQTWKLLLNGFPDEVFIKLPFGKLQRVSHIRHTDMEGVTHTWDPSNYIIDKDSEPGKIFLGYGKSWPTSKGLYVCNPVQIEFICGYGDDETKVPSTIRKAIKIAITDLFNNPESIVIAPGGVEIEHLKTFERLLWPKRLFGAWDTEQE